MSNIGLRENFLGRSKKVDVIREKLESFKFDRSLRKEVDINELTRNFLEIGKCVEEIEHNSAVFAKTQRRFKEYIKDMKGESDYHRAAAPVEVELDEEFDNFNVQEFLDPKLGSKLWFEEQPQKMEVLYKKKKFKEASMIVKEVRAQKVKDYEVFIFNKETET